MGKKITVYLTDDETKMLEDVCKKPLTDNQSRAIKVSLSLLWDICEHGFGNGTLHKHGLDEYVGKINEIEVF
jgi:hypothetical protein